MTTITLNGQQIALDLTAMTASAREKLLSAIAKLQQERDEYKKAYEQSQAHALKSSIVFEQAKRQQFKTH